MSQPFLSQISIFPLMFAVDKWAFCDGQVLAVAQYNALYSLLGTNFGGNGYSNFQLPELRGRVAVHQTGSFPYIIGQRSGTETQTLTTDNLPAHTHGGLYFGAADVDGTEAPSTLAVAAIPKVGDIVGKGFSTPDGSEVQLASSGSRTESMGSGDPFSIMDPFLVMNYEIAMVGAYPQRA
ncbi:phage tail protein [Pseudovibrio exalbescens]|nr:tail fiber protein [Pseudovibrio exalbescens]